MTPKKLSRDDKSELKKSADIVKGDLLVRTATDRFNIPKYTLLHRLIGIKQKKDVANFYKRIVKSLN